MLCRSARHLFISVENWFPWQQHFSYKYYAKILWFKIFPIFFPFFAHYNLGYYIYVGGALPAGVFLITDSDISSFFYLSMIYVKYLNCCTV